MQNYSPFLYARASEASERFIMYRFTCLRVRLSPFPRVETRFYTHFQNAFANAFLELLRLSSNYRDECLATAQLHCAVDPYMPLRRLDRRYKRLSKLLCVYHIYRNVFFGSNALQIALLFGISESAFIIKVLA